MAVKKSEREIDRQIGARVRQIRLLRRMTQTELGDAVDLTFQQIQKYENGANRIGGSRLWQFCHIFDVPITYFFEDIKQQPKKNHLATLLEQPETIKLVRNYHAIKDEEVRKGAYALLHGLAKSKDM